MRAPVDRKEFDAITYDRHFDGFTLEFNVDMFTANDLNTLTASYPELLTEFRAHQGGFVIYSSKAFVLDVLKAVTAWGEHIPIGADGLWNLLQKQNAKKQGKSSMICAFGSKSNRFNDRRKKIEQEFRLWGLMQYESESAIAPIAIYVAIRNYITKVIKLISEFPTPLLWNSDSHKSFDTVQKVLFENNMKILPCTIHRLRYVSGNAGIKKFGNCVDELIAQLFLMRESGSSHMFEWERTQFIDIWQRKYKAAPSDHSIKSCIDYLVQCEDVPFFTTKAGMPGHTCDNQSIESVMNQIRLLVGGGNTNEPLKYDLRGLTLALPDITSKLGQRLVGE